MNEVIIVNGIPVSISAKVFYDGSNVDTGIDFSITKNENSYTVDVFDADILDNEDAYLDSFETDTLQDAVDLGFNYRQE